MTKDQIRQFLLEYAWLGTAEEQAREVECILAQEDVELFVEVKGEQYDGAQDPDNRPEMDGEMFALTALYECHDGPHLPTCPRSKD